LCHGSSRFQDHVVHGIWCFLQAEVTGGGIPLSEINCSTMQSRKLKGLYLCGEICDVFGRIGGFNFYWAWLSGRLAGVSAALDA
jgi:predicted flavoprotein YhiN